MRYSVTLCRKLHRRRNGYCLLTLLRRGGVIGQEWRYPNDWILSTIYIRDVVDRMVSPIWVKTLDPCGRNHNSENYSEVHIMTCHF